MDYRAILFDSCLMTDVFVIIFLSIMAYKAEYSLGRQRQIKYFHWMLVGLILFTAFSGIYSFQIFKEIELKGPLLFFTSFGIYLPSTYSLMKWMNFVAYTADPKVDEHRVWQVLSWFPIMVEVFLFISPLPKSRLLLNPASLFDPDVFTVVICIVDSIYILTGLILTIIGTIKITRKSYQHFYFSLYAYLISTLFGAVIKALHPYTPALELSFIPGSFLIFAALQRAQSSSDALTGLNNRHRTDEYLEQLLLQASESRPVELFVLDLDYFKAINDVMGHQEGDRALKIFSEALRRSSIAKRTMLGRWGGDEFVAITINGFKNPEFLIGRLTENIKKIRLERGIKYDICFSFGHTVCTDPKTKASDLFKMTDQKLYVNKKNHHEINKSYKNDMLILKNTQNPE